MIPTQITNAHQQDFDDYYLWYSGLVFISGIIIICTCENINESYETNL